MLDRIRNMAAALRMTPLHPQWFAFMREERNLAITCEALSGTVLDVGCAEGSPRKFLPPDTRYVGLDYYTTATGWYATRPDLYGDAQLLPLADSSVDHALLLDVLEHLPDPNRCLTELHRVIKPAGSLTIQVPFIYPLHDAPLDFHRWTRYGLRQAAKQRGFTIESESAIGHPLETGCSPH
jgi:SAM-dependent methyltransferase